MATFEEVMMEEIRMEDAAEMRFALEETQAYECPFYDDWTCGDELCRHPQYSAPLVIDSDLDCVGCMDKPQA
jgi:hypothetical protein